MKRRIETINEIGSSLNQVLEDSQDWLSLDLGSFNIEIGLRDSSLASFADIWEQL